MNWIFDRRLPKAPLMTIELQPKTFDGKRLYAYFRLANCWLFKCGYFSVMVRAPWLIRPAHQLHPHLFRMADGGQHGDGLCGCTERCRDRDNCQYEGTKNTDAPPAALLGDKGETK